MTRPTPEFMAAVISDRKAGMTLRQLAEKNAVSLTTIKRWTKGIEPDVPVVRAQKPPVAYSAEKRRYILDEHYASGRSTNASARKHDISHRTLKRWIDLDDAWRDDDPGADMQNGEWVLCPRRRIQVWRAA